MEKNIILTTDSYKVCHWNQYPKGTQYVYSYFEARSGAKYDKTIFFGLQAIIYQHLLGEVVTVDKINEAEKLCKAHFGNEYYFNRKGWEHIVEKHKGRLPVIIKAVPEGTPVENSNVLMTIENTDPECYWLTNYLETILSQVWYPSTIASKSYALKRLIKSYLETTSESTQGLEFKLHDFGFRGASSFESAAIGGAAHLINFKGTDTLAAMQFAKEYYFATFENLAFSVAATEHSIMTSCGRDGEEKLVGDLLLKYPTGILSVVADSYNIYEFVHRIVGETYKKSILERDGVFVIRPDSITPQHQTPEEEMLWIAIQLWYTFGGKVNKHGYRVINPKVRILWGDGIDFEGIEKILETLKKNGFSAENVATFGMGGGLLQKINRDTQRFAFKSSAQCVDGEWHDICKQPLDNSKMSKKGKLKLGFTGEKYFTTSENTSGVQNYLKVIFKDGIWAGITGNGEYPVTFDQVRKNGEK